MEVVQLSMQTNSISVMRLIEWCIGRATVRMLVAVSRVRVRMTVHRVRARVLVVGSPSVAQSSLRQAYLRLRRYQPNITYSEKRMACELLAFMTTNTSRFSILTSINNTKADFHKALVGMSCVFCMKKKKRSFLRLQKIYGQY